MPRGNAARKTTIWLGNDDGNPGGYTGFGFDVTREDDMIRIGATVNDDRGEELEVFILPDLFPKMLAVMEVIREQQGRAAHDK